MNPVLLKPSSDTGAQVIIHGRALTNMEAGAYNDYKKIALQAVLQSYRRLADNYQAVVVEGAGSPAEINLRDNDIANMGFAEAADCPVVLVADIDRGGVFAHLVGTLELLSQSERERVVGFVINKFRGDIALLQPGLGWLERKTGKPVLGVLPYLPDFHLDAEDAIDSRQQLDRSRANLTVCVPVFSRISNHTDFDALRLHPQVDLQYVGPGQAIPPCDLIVLPGSKNVRRDLQGLLDSNWRRDIHKHLRYGGKLIGICGGYQMLGRQLSDPQGIEGPPGTSAGLGLLQLDTELAADKQLKQVTGELTLGSEPVSGYEIHCGATSGEALQRPLALLADGGPEGAISTDGQIIGTYLHGLFDHPAAGRALLRWAGLAEPEGVDPNAIREQQLDRLADAIEQHLDCDSLFASPMPATACAGGSL